MTRAIVFLALALSIAALIYIGVTFDVGTSYPALSLRSFPGRVADA